MSLLRLVGPRIPSSSCLPNINNVMNFARIFSTSPHRTNNLHGGDDKSRLGSKRNGIITTIGAAVAIGGLALAYKSFTEESQSEEGEGFALKLTSNYRAKCANKQCDVSNAPELLPKCGPEKTSDVSKAPESKSGGGAGAELMMQKAKANQDLEKALEAAKDSAMKAFWNVRVAICEAETLFKTTDELCEEIQKDGRESARLSKRLVMGCILAMRINEKVKDVIQKDQHAVEELKRFREIIENGKAGENTKSNALLTTAEEFLVHAEQKQFINRAKWMECIGVDALENESMSKNQPQPQTAGKHLEAFTVGFMLGGIFTSALLIPFIFLWK